MRNYFWINKSMQKRIAVLVAGILTFTTIGLTPANTANNIAYAATTSVADQPNLGYESFWNYSERDLGAGWKWSVNTATGNLVLDKVLFNITGRSIPLGEEITYNSNSSQDIGVGSGWTLTSAQYLQGNGDGSVTYKDENATNHTFSKNADGSYSSPAGIFLTLTKLQTGVFTIKDNGLNLYRFEYGRLVNVTDEKGNITTYTYDAANNLIRMTDSSNRSLTYAYNGNGKLQTITDPANRIVQFSYNANGNLSTITDPKGSITQFSYNAANKVSSFIDANGRTTGFVYDANGKLTKTTDARTTGSQEYATTFQYNTQTLTTTVTDAAGKTSTYVHNSSGNVTQYTNGAGNVFTNNWSQNKLVTSSDSKGSTSLQYDAQGNITQFSDTLTTSTSAVTNVQYDSKNNPVQVTDANNNKTLARYDENSNAISAADPNRLEADGKTYDSFGNVTSSSSMSAPTYNQLQNGSFERLDTNSNPINWNKGGTTTAISIDNTVAIYAKQSLKISSVTTASAFLYSNAVSTSGGKKLTLSAKGKLTQLAGTVGADIGLEFYDSSFNFVGSSYSNGYTGSGNVNFVVTATAPANSAYVIAIVELDQAIGTVWFDGVQLESPLKDDEGHVLTEFEYVENSSFEWGGSQWGAGGTPGTVSVTSESAWAGAYSAKLNLTSAGDSWIGSANIPVRPGEPLTLSGYVKTVGLTGIGARVEIEYYDASGTFLDYSATKFQLGTQDFTRYAISTVPPANAAYGRVYGVTYSSTGVVFVDNIQLTPRATTVYTYDTSGNYVTNERDAIGNLTQYAYDAAGNKTSDTNPRGYTTGYTYDQNNNLTSVTDAQQKKTYYSYDPVNFQVSIRDGRSASSSDNSYLTTFTYNQLNQITSMMDALGKTTTTAYDQAGNKQSVTYPNSKQVSYAYDSANRLSSKNYIGTTKNWTYTYDGASNLSQAKDDQNRTYSFAYDGSNRLTQLTNLFGYQLNYQLDKVGNVSSVTDTNGKTTAYTYGSQNRLLSLSDSSGRTTSYRYNGQGLPFEITRGNGIKSVQVYDTLGRLTQLADPGNPNNSVYYYEYDANGNITKIYSNTGVQSFSYDELNRLTSWTDEAGNVTTYQFDAAGNLLKKGNTNYSYNAVNQITNAGFTYDVNGNLTSDGQYNYTYDNENQLIQVNRVSDSSLIASYDYDYRGLRISKTTSAGTIYFHWDDKKRLVRESDTSGNTLTMYIYNSADQLVSFEKGGSMHYVHTNHRGDILGITDVNKNQVATYNYGPWGEFISKTGSIDIPMRYAGYYYDNETGLYYLKARYYNPIQGRFITRDSVSYNEIFQPQSLNLYAYVQGNPVMQVDPDGHFAWAAGALFFIPGVNVVAAVALTTVAIGAGIYVGVQMSKSKDWDSEKGQDKLYDRNRAEKGRGADAKARERKQIDDAFGKDRAQREKNSQDLHRDKKGGRNDDNKTFKDLKKYKR